MARQGNFQTDAECRTGKGGDDRLAAFLGLEIHPCKFDLSLERVELHDAVKEATRRICPSTLLHLCNDIQIHATGKVLFARRDDNAFDGGKRQCLVDQAIQFGNTLK